MVNKFKRREDKNYIIITTIFALIMIFLILYFAMEGDNKSSSIINEQNLSIFEKAKVECIQLCKDELSKNVDLSSGPCLSDNSPKWNIQGWVCDVAHYPREAIDNNPNNQCKAYLEGKATHFVEVTPDCKFIREH